jgi:[glutamine synthetase] adenylyltransferase / [glutamine synthetase]-adenylyl-L-tyrosine phosphorylase
LSTEDSDMPRPRSHISAHHVTIQDARLLVDAVAAVEPPDAPRDLLARLGFADVPLALLNIRRLRDRLPTAALLALLRPLLEEASRSPDPDMALSNVERILLACTDARALAKLWRAEKAALRNVVQLCATSQLLADILVEMADSLPADLARPEALARRTADALAEGARLATAPEAGHEPRLNALRRFKRRELLRIAARDVLQLASFGELVEEISDLATACIQAMLELCFGQTPRPDRPAGAPDDWWREFAVIAMGKLGGRELNYSSDVDLLFVYDAPWAGSGETPEPVRRCFLALATAFTQAVGALTADGALFRVDLRLRPEGGAGALARSLDGYEAYYESWGAAWERQALIKAAWVAGSRPLAERFLRMTQQFVYGKRLETEGVAEIKAVKARVEASARRAGEADDVKLGPGGIRDIEFTVQFLQLVFGPEDERVRERGTLGALRALAHGKYLTATERQTLASAYVFLRTVEHQLQLMHGLSARRLPSDGPSLDKLARRLGLRETEGTTPATLLLSEFHRHTEATRALFGKLFAEMFEARSDADLRVRGLVLSRDEDETTEGEVLREYGVADVQRAAAALRRLAHGTVSAPLPASAAERFADLASITLQAASRTPDPDASLSRFEDFCRMIGSHSALYDLLTREPQTTEMLVRVAGCSASLSAILTRHPEYFDMLMDAAVMGSSRSRDDMAGDLAERLEGLSQAAARMQAIQRFRRRELLRIGVRDLMDEAGIETTLRELTDLAETCLAATLEAAALSIGPDLPFAVIGLGKLGGREMHYNSDLDVMFVSRAPPEGGTREHLTRLASDLLSLVELGAAGAGPPLRLDARLRPQGESGPLVRSVGGLADYYARYAEPWERLALVRARFVAGDGATGRAFAEAAEPFLWGRGLASDELAQILHAKERIERERAASGADIIDIKLGPGGISDVEFCVQLLQLAYGGVEPDVRVPGTLAALRALAAHGLLPRPEDGTRLEAAYLLLRKAESRLQLSHDWDESAISPETGGRPGLARLLSPGAQAPAEGAIGLAEELDAHLRAVREAFAATVALLRGAAQ